MTTTAKNTPHPGYTSYIEASTSRSSLHLPRDAQSLPSISFPFPSENSRQPTNMGFNFTAEHLRQASGTSSLNANSVSSCQKQGHLTSSFTSIQDSQACTSLKFVEVDYAYSILRFATENVDIQVNGNMPADNIIQAHISSMKRYLDDFDAAFEKR